VRHGYISKGKIIMKVKAVYTEAVNWLELAKDKLHWSAFVLTVA
jgi:hypothetical protein